MTSFQTVCSRRLSLPEIGLPPKVPRAIQHLTSRVHINSWIALSGVTRSAFRQLRLWSDEHSNHSND
jgi:hypothetical protein